MVTSRREYGRNESFGAAIARYCGILAARRPPVIFVYGLDGPHLIIIFSLLAGASGQKQRLGLAAPAILDGFRAPGSRI